MLHTIIGCEATVQIFENIYIIIHIGLVYA